MTLEQFLDELSKLSTPGKGFKPHKHLALLAVIGLVRQGVIQTPRIAFDDAFRLAFSTLLKKFGDDTDRDRPHNPFFHLSRHLFWRLTAKPGLESALDAVTTVGSAGDLQRLVSHADLQQAVFDLFKDPSSSEKIERRLESLVRTGIESRSENPTRDGQTAVQSLFAHEAAALDSISQHVKSHALGVALPSRAAH